MNNFAVLETTKLHLTNAIVIKIATNNPCHLTCYYSEKPPGRHKTSRTDRGITLPWGAYFCFVAYNSVEQIEAGDTLSHTFVVPDWFLSQLRWFVFRGTVAGVLSPSVSCIFKHLHTGQTLILNPGMEDWSGDPGNEPDHWKYPPGEPTTFFSPDNTIKVEGQYSCRCDNTTATGTLRIGQSLPVALLSGLPITFLLAYRGANYFRNWFRFRAVGDTSLYAYDAPTKDYQWEDLAPKATLPANLSLLYLQAQNWNQFFPTPFQTWWDDCRVLYTP